MTTKSLSQVLSSFDRYPQTQQALRALWERCGETAVCNTAQTLQMIARDAIDGDFSLLSTDADLFSVDPAIVQEIREVARIFIAEQSSLQ